MSWLWADDRLPEEEAFELVARCDRCGARIAANDGTWLGNGGWVMLHMMPDGWPQDEDYDSRDRHLCPAEDCRVAFTAWTLGAPAAALGFTQKRPRW